jgi:pSer/pThr/pTyr-binding forkhead associated (FHA) protein
MIRVRVTEAGGSRIVVLPSDRVIVGRVPPCEVVVDDPGVSRRHAELSREAGGWSVRDLGSANGTFVNETAVEEARLSPGDLVRLGPEATLEWLGEDEADQTPDEADAGEVVPARRPARAAAGAGPRGAAGPASWLARVTWVLEPLAAGAETVRLAASVTSVGRDPGAGLVLHDESVSRMHARLDPGADGLVVTDLKSRNGTFLDDQPVLRATARPGHVVRFGDVAFRVERSAGLAWGRVALLVGGILVVAIAVGAAMRIGQSLDERAGIEAAAHRAREQAIENTRAGIAASRAGEAELAREYLLHAADLLLLADLAPRGASLDRPAECFRGLLPSLPAEEREFDFASALDPSVVESSRARLATLTNREYVEYQLRRYAIELNQDRNVPPGFVEQVWRFVQEYERYPGSMNVMLRRARDLQPRIRTILASRHLPESFCYVAWVESGLDPRQRSPVGALGLWQLMPAVARERGLRVSEDGAGVDQRTDVERSTLAAADFLAILLRDQGPEYFMLVLASYNRGPGALDRAKQKVLDPMLPATRKYWYLVEHNLLPRETRDYVPKIFAVRLIAEAPERFGFEVP